MSAEISKCSNCGDRRFEMWQTLMPIGFNPDGTPALAAGMVTIRCMGCGRRLEDANGNHAIDRWNIGEGVAPYRMDPCPPMVPANRDDFPVRPPRPNRPDPRA